LLINVYETVFFTSNYIPDLIDAGSSGFCVGAGG